MIVSASEFRRHLLRYLDLAQSGEQITIVKHSSEVAVLVGAEVQRVLARTVETSMELGDGRTVTFRMFGIYEDGSCIQEMQPISIEFCGDNPAAYFEKYEGEFWVAKVETVVIAYGGWRPSWEIEDAASIEHVAVSEQYAVAGARKRMQALLEQRAERRGFSQITS
jgi:prevent-host-death family protein